MKVQLVLCVLFISGVAFLHPVRCEQKPKFWILMHNAPSEVRGISNAYDPDRCLKELKALDKKLSKFSAGQDTDKILDLIQNSQLKLTKLHLFSKKAEEKVVQLFKKLKEAREECNYESYLVQASIFSVFNEHRDILNGDTPTYLLSMDVLRQHGQNCRAGYFSRFKETSIDEEASGKIDFFLGSATLNEAVAQFAKSGDILYDLRIGGDTFKNAIPYIYDRLVEVAKEEVEKRHKTYLKEVWDNEIEEKHLIEPCRAYIEPLKGIFYPAELDILLDSSKIDEINPTKDVGFFKAWTKFHFCSIVSASPLFGARLNDEHFSRLNQSWLQDS